MTALKRLLAAAKERSRALDERRQAQAEGMSVSTKFESNPARRGENLRILRAFMSGHQYSFVDMLGIGSQSYYSNIECGKTQLCDNEARKVESDLGLPLGWLDRNNGEAIFFSSDELRLIQELRKSSPAATTALIETMKNVRADRAVPTN